MDLWEWAVSVTLLLVVFGVMFADGDLERQIKELRARIEKLERQK
jgi:hypothetical protein